MPITETGSVRVDLVGGTLDLDPLHLILKNVVTINLATSLSAKVVIEEASGVVISSKDYQQELSLSEAMKDPNWELITSLLHHFKAENIKIGLESGSPPGAGLGGSSAMGITLYKALCQWSGKTLDKEDAVKVVKNVEAKLLGQGPAGYQDLYPALYGGVLALFPKIDGIKVEQLYDPSLASFLEDNLLLVYSGIQRRSGVTNWEVYKQFFDGDKKTVQGLQAIATLSSDFYQAIKEKRHSNLLELIGEEGKLRESLFAGIVPSKIHEIVNKLSLKGLKMCGAGGGGCFLINCHRQDKTSLVKAIEAEGLRVLDFKIRPSLS